MARDFVIKKERNYKSGTGFVVLIRDTQLNEVREVDYWISAGVNLENALANNIDGFFDAGQVVVDGAQEFDRLQERGKADVHEDALFAAVQTLRGGGTLDQMTAAMEAVYVADGSRVNLITDFIQAYNAATNAEKSRFLAVMVYVLGAMVRK